jgi:hypothetical protein
VNFTCILRGLPLVLPREGPCIAAYGEHVNAVRPPVVWWARTSDAAESSSVTVRLETLDAKRMRGTLRGVFDMPDDPARSPQTVTIQSLGFHLPTNSQPSILPGAAGQ